MAAALAIASAGAQQQDPLTRGMSHEEAERFREAAAAYREVLVAEPANLPALLGLERSYASLGATDSLLPLVHRALAERPADPTLRTMQLRALRMLADPAGMRAAFEAWTKVASGDAAPYREYARVLLQNGQTATADSVLRQAGLALGTTRGVELELAQLRAAMGLWEPSAQSWRIAVAESPYLEQAALFALLPAPGEARERIRAVLLAPPIEPGARRIIGSLELEWGAPRAGWNALRALPGDTASVRAWLDFAQRAEHAQAWLVARDALTAVFSRTRAPEHVMRAATAALNGGDSRSALALAARAGNGSGASQVLLPVHLRALASLGRAEEAERLLQESRGSLAPDQVEQLARIVAFGWIRAGDVPRARKLLGDSGDWQGEPIAGWMALYEGDLRTARRRLRPRGGDAEPVLVSALALLSRTRADSAPAIGVAFLALARGDTAAAAAAFQAAARTVPDVAPLLFASAARLYTARSDDAHAVPIWRAVLDRYPASAEAPEAELEWARALRRNDDPAAAIARLEHMILTYPSSALVPQARRELDLARASVPPTP
ncbi:MAG TPA: hypothetical protein VML57_03410 [Burkholderiales bacterium]|nr:hypothetical protein [Burkholderiales bacterium]